VTLQLYYRIVTRHADSSMACNLAGLDEWTPAVSRTGELWLLGDHRVLVADATVENDVRRLMGADVADLTFADPPYNVSYEGYTEDRLTIRGDRMSDEGV